MTTLYRIELTKAHLDQIPHNERVFYLMASQLSNDLNVLAKLLWFASNGPADDDVRTPVGTAQGLLIIKMMAGRLHEGRALLNKAFSAKRLWDKYKNDLTPEGRKSFEQINRYFGRPNIVEKIRNKFASHLDVPAIDATYDQLPQDAPFVDYLASEHAGHNLFYGAEWLTLVAMMNATGESDWRDAVTKIYGETTQVSVWFCVFIQSFIRVMLARYIGLTMEDLTARAVAVTDDPPIDEVRLPFFCPPPRVRPPELEPARRRGCGRPNLSLPRRSARVNAKPRSKV